MTPEVASIRYGFPLPQLFAFKRGDPGKRCWCLCPFHDDQTASLLVTRHDRHGWRAHCFACGWDGDAIAAVMELERCSFRAALEKLGESEPGKWSVRLPPPLPPPPYELRCDVAGCTNTVAVPNELEAAIYRAGLRAWEVAPDGVGAVCPRCLLGSA